MRVKFNKILNSLTWKKQAATARTKLLPFRCTTELKRQYNGNLYNDVDKNEYHKLIDKYFFIQ